MSDGLPRLSDVIAAHGLAAKKSLGQNFLLDLNLTRRIARAAGPVEGETFYEVGPGPGGLTRALLAEGAARVVAVERDPRCIPALHDIAAFYPGRLEIVEGDALAIQETQLFSAPVRVAANLPYNVGTAILIKWLSAETWPSFWSSLTLMFQREVAERVVAQPGGKAYGRLSVLTQWRARPKILFDVGRHAFVPPPNVTSSILRLEPLNAPVAEARLEDLEKVTAAAFGQRRKMLRQSLKALSPQSDALLEQAGIEPSLRAEVLTVPQFAALARAYRALVEGG